MFYGAIEMTCSRQQCGTGVEDADILAKALTRENIDGREGNKSVLNRTA